MHRLVRKFRREVGQISVRVEARSVRRRHLLLLELQKYPRTHTKGQKFITRISLPFYRATCIYKEKKKWSTHRFPIYQLKEGVSLDFLEALLLAAAQPLGWVLAQEALQYARGVVRQRSWDSDRLVENHLEEIVLGVLIGILRGAGNVEGASPREHLKQQNAQRPPVHGEAVVLAAQDLRGNVVGRAAEGGRCVAVPDALLAHPIVGELHVSLVIQQHVVKLQVAIDNALLMQEIQCQADLRGVEARVFLGQTSLPLHVEH